MKAITQRQALEYEVHAAAWWVGLIGWTPLQKLGGRYFAWKAGRKWARYQTSLAGRRARIQAA